MSVKLRRASQRGLLDDACSSPFFKKSFAFFFIAGCKALASGSEALFKAEIHAAGAYVHRLRVCFPGVHFSDFSEWLHCLVFGFGYTWLRPGLLIRLSEATSVGKVIYHLLTGPVWNEITQVALQLRDWNGLVSCDMKYECNTVRKSTCLCEKTVKIPFYVDTHQRTQHLIGWKYFPNYIHKSLHGNVHITSPRVEKCLCVCAHAVCERCVPKCERVCLPPSNKWCMCKLGKFSLYLVMKILVEWISFGATGWRGTPMKQNKDLVKNAPLMCGVSAWVHTLRVQCCCQHGTQRQSCELESSIACNK